MGTEVQTTQAQPPAVQIRETVATIKARVQMVQHLLREVMKPDVHYGKIPGTPKPSLWQPGAEIIALAFNWAERYTTEDLSTPTTIRYRVLCELWSRDTGEFMGSGQGECSSDEEKYKWRKAVNAAEWEATFEDRRRVKFAHNNKTNSDYTINQVRIEPADVANTILKQAGKRGFVGATKTVSATSDMFAQDLEDLPPEVREGMTGEAEKPAPPKPVGQKGWETLLDNAADFGYTIADVLATAAIAGHEGPGPDMPRDLSVRIFRSMRDNPRTAEPEPEDDTGLEGDDEITL